MVKISQGRNRGSWLKIALTKCAWKILDRVVSNGWWVNGGRPSAIVGTCL
jgi:hypothetical protein